MLSQAQRLQSIIRYRALLGQTIQGHATKIGCQRLGTTRRVMHDLLMAAPSIQKSSSSNAVQGHPTIYSSLARFIKKAISKPLKLCLDYYC